MLKFIKYHIFLIGLFCTFSICTSANTNNIPVNISDEYAPQGVETACIPDCPETRFLLSLCGTMMFPFCYQMDVVY